MKDTLLNIIQKLNTASVQFADVRYSCSDDEVLYFEQGELKEYSTNLAKKTIGIRVLRQGCWGFAGTNDLSPHSIDRAIQSALSSADHGSRFMHKKVSFPPQKPVQASYLQKPQIDPFTMDREEKMAWFSALARDIHQGGRKDIVFDYLVNHFHRESRIYANTEGTVADSLSYHVLPLFSLIAASEKGTQTRTFPGHMSAASGGFEQVLSLGMEDHIEACVKEARDLLDAPTISEEKADIIIGNGHLALQLHESVGHATEADRIFGMEISYAGKTFVKPEMLGTFKYGSPEVTIYSDSSDPRGIGYHPVDDEGIPGKKVTIIDKGILVDQQTDRAIAHELGLSPSSNMKSSHAYDYPLVRMTNFCLSPGRGGSLDELIRSTERGYLLDHTKTWSIDDNRYNFQFTTEIGWKIEEGEITGIVKEPTYYGITPEFWNSCDAVCDESEWQYMGTFDCGKGQPGQVLHLSHGVAPARFKNVTVNVKA